jgi:hypothetical protein
MKKIALIAVACMIAVASAFAGLDTTGLTYTTVASGTVAGGTASTNGLAVWVDVSALKGNAKLIITDTVVTPTAGAYAAQVFTGSATNAVTTLAATATTSTNAASISTVSLDTQALSKYVQLRWTCMETTTVHHVNAVLVSY